MKRLYRLGRLQINCTISWRVAEKMSTAAGAVVLPLVKVAPLDDGRALGVHLLHPACDCEARIVGVVERVTGVYTKSAAPTHSGLSS